LCRGVEVPEEFTLDFSAASHAAITEGVKVPAVNLQPTKIGYGAVGFVKRTTGDLTGGGLICYACHEIFRGFQNYNPALPVLEMHFR
jgi:hypothetical protein